MLHGFNTKVGKTDLCYVCDITLNYQVPNKVYKFRNEQRVK